MKRLHLDMLFTTNSSTAPQAFVGGIVAERAAEARRRVPVS
jgi:hypothetical protein